MPKCNIHCTKCNMHRVNAQHAPRNVQRIALNSHHATCNTAASRSSLMSIAKLSFPARAWCAVVMRGARLMRVVSCTLHLGTRTIILQLASCALQATRCTGTAQSRSRAASLLAVGITMDRRNREWCLPIHRSSCRPSASGHRHRCQRHAADRDAAHVSHVKCCMPRVACCMPRVACCIPRVACCMPRVKRPTSVQPREVRAVPLGERVIPPSKVARSVAPFHLFFCDSQDEVTPKSGRRLEGPARLDNSRASVC
jgi:hypothetical protein